MAAVVELVTASYPIEASDAALVRSFNNDVFRVRADGQDYALKLYGAARFTADEVRWEQQLAPSSGERWSLGRCRRDAA